MARGAEVWHNHGTMAATAPKNTVAVGPQGRLVVPSTVRHQLGIVPGDTLLVSVEGNRLVFEKREAVLKRIRERFAHIPSDVSLADELIADRRAEATKE